MWYGSPNGAVAICPAPSEIVLRVGGRDSPATAARGGAEMGDKAKGKGKQLKKPKTDKEKKAK